MTNESYSINSQENPSSDALRIQNEAVCLKDKLDLLTKEVTGKLNSSACNNKGEFHLLTTKPNLISEKVSNISSSCKESDLRINMDGDNYSKFPHSTTLDNSSDGLQMLLIQKECEIVCLRSELEFYKKQNHVTKLADDETDDFLLCKNDDSDSISLAEKENNSISEELTNVQRYVGKDNTLCPSSKTFSQGVNIACQTIPSLMNCGDGRDLKSQETSALEESTTQMEILDSANLLRNPAEIAQKIQEYYRKEYEREKHVLNEKELQLQQETFELEELRERLHIKREELDMNKMKIEMELKKILEDDESSTDMEIVEEKSEKEKTLINKDQTYDIKYPSKLSLILSSDDDESIFESDYLQINIDQEPPRQKVRRVPKTSNVEIQKMDECRTKDSTDAVTKELINVCESKINDLYNFMSIWKSDAEKQVQETETMLNELAKRNEVFEHHTPRSNTCHEIVNALSKEWDEVRELREEIKKQRDDLITQKSELEARAIAIEEKEKILNEDKTESEKRKMILNENWDCLQSEAELLSNEKQMLIKEIQSLEETKNALEKEKNELIKLKAQYEEEMQMAEEIQKQVDECRAETMLEQQKCLDEKWEALDNEKEEVKKAWRRYENKLLALEIEKNSVSRERKELKTFQQSLEKERLSLEENRHLQEEEWKKIWSQSKDLENNIARVKDEKKVITEELRRLDSEKIKVKEMIESLNRRKEEIREEEKVLGENKLKIMNEKENLDKLKAETETEWKKIKNERKEWICKKDEQKKEKSIISKKIENSESMRKIKNKIYKLAETVCTMEKDAAMLNATKNQRFAEYPEKERLEKRLNQRCQCSEYFQEKVYSLLELLNNMEEDALKIRIKFNEQTKFHKRMKIMRKKIKCGKIKCNKPRQNKEISNNTYRKEISSVLTPTGMTKNGVMTGMREPVPTKCEQNIGMNVIPRLQNDRENSFTTVLREDYITDLTPRRANYAKEKAKYLVDEWKKTYIIQGDNFHSTILLHQEDAQRESYKQRFEKIDLNCWEKYSVDKIKVAELTPSRTYAEGLTAIKEIRPRPCGKSQCTYTAAHSSDNLQCSNTFSCLMQKLENGFKMYSPFSYASIEKPNLSASSRVRRERTLSVQKGCLNHFI
ncbi:hypothetical protein J437_LFUL010210 [Ladona fulva]|uniref:Uncharacterized protein n=1 Tax=Ladona fulva TaxID=123851 RepID=A0A8K0K8E5_LADFU|nr:hypothetical protein J437_LFUL010210 [Ladona fulva]